MIISLINRTSIPDVEVLRVMRAVNRQLKEDFFPHWHIDVQMRLEGEMPGAVDIQRAPNLRGDAILYLVEEYDENSPFGFHDMNRRGIPFGVVFTQLSTDLGEPWSVTLSHEALELAADAEVNRLAMGPHPDDPSRDVFHWYEMCDAVQAETYDIDEVSVSNFVLPHYFTPGEETACRNDFLGSDLRSFGINPGGYVGYFDPETGEHEQSFANQASEERAAIKSQYGMTRRTVRHSDFAGFVRVLNQKPPVEDKPVEDQPDESTNEDKPIEDRPSEKSA